MATRVGDALMAISVQCPSCAKYLKVRDELAGKRLECPGCGQIFVVAAEAASQPTPIPRPAERPRQDLNRTVDLPSPSATAIEAGLTASFDVPADALGATDPADGAGSTADSHPAAPP